MKNYVLDTTLLPEVWITWLGKDGRIWMNNNGERQDHSESWMAYDFEHNLKRWRNGVDGRVAFGSCWSNRNSDKLWVAAGSQLYYAYAKYHEDIDRLELAAVRYDTTRGKGKHTWMYDGDRFFIGKDKSVVNEKGTPYSDIYNVKKRRSVNCAKDMISTILRLNANDKLMGEFKKFIGHNYYIIGNGTSVDITHPWHLSKWYTSVQKARSSGKSQKLVDELVKLPLGEIGHLSGKYLPKTIYNRYGDKEIKNIIYFERVNDKWSVLRALIRTDNGCFDEAWRVYLGDDGTNRIATKANGDWIPSSQQKGWGFRNSYYLANKEEGIEKCNRIKYIAPIIESENDVNTLITILRFPTIEQLYKMGHKNLALQIAHSSTPKAAIKEIFGGYYKEKESSVLRQVGMTKYQLDAYCNKCSAQRYYDYNVMKRMRETLGEDLSRVDNVTYGKYLNAFDEFLCNFWADRYVDCLEIDKSRFWKNLVRLIDKNNSAARLISDTLSVYNRLHGVRPEIDWIFDSQSDIIRAHDALTALHNEQQAEQRAYYNMAEAERRRKDDEKRKKVDEERKFYEYEDENFIIRLPKDVQEIVTEGTSQRICIGGYTSRHSRGETNLFFLRKKNDEAVPFYAIEMNNDKRIVQIHGFGNKWLGNNPEAIPTVVRWLRKHNIKCDNSILTCAAKGYSRRNEYIPMPIVD